ncbi:hypothetical protein SAICODRAFT_31966 [Saitoella complicata NRRL Y-17804]|uniref:uncharacterized protein n=1 Tax=Saitoella complicata (strain BCRC 22490 / CBS 7301 / JCM 7358 / NBRC 10748 / NRRL Y-17804) TaxID=698492 RepID=UPI00086801CA|nr:uncharacterized protein SAICODRAFT_31966 [Saitoella complicata NRRL Y-17804]ODQ50431.1 hypothetical protein SAICODRAFT_31966 [Saitoella complicata NRRL Y-17804]
MKSNLGATAYMIRIVAFWGRVTTYVNSSTTPSLWSNVANKKRIAPWLPQSEFSTLVADLKGWHDDLPAWLKYTPENLAAHVSINAAPPYVFMHIAYHTVLCTLHRFSVPSNSSPGAKGGPSAALGTGPAVAAGEEAPPADFVASSVAACFYHARQISLIMTDLRARADECQITAPFVGFAIFTASLFHLHKAYASSPGTSAEAVEEAKRFLALGVEVLDQLRKWWGPLEGLFLALSNLVKAQTAGPSPMVGMQGFAPSVPPRSAAGLDLTGTSARNTPVLPVASSNSTLGVVGLSKAPTPQPGGAQQQWDPTSMIQMASNLEGFGYREGSPSNDFSFLDMMFAEGANGSNFASMPGSPRMGGPFSANPTRPGSPRTQQQPTMQNSFNMPFPGAIADPMRASPGASVAAVAPASGAKPSYTRYESTPAATPVPAAGNGSAETVPRSVDGFLQPPSPRPTQAKAFTCAGTGTGTAPHSPVLTTDGLQHPTPSHPDVQTGPGLADETLGKDADAADLLVYFQKQCSGAASSGATPVPAAVEHGDAVAAGTKRTADGQPKASDGGASRADISHLLDAGRQ